MKIWDDGNVWVVIQINRLGEKYNLGQVGSLQIWKCRGNVVWESPGYDVLGYVKGYYKQVSQYVNSLPENQQPWDKDVHV